MRTFLIFLLTGGCLVLAAAASAAPPQHFQFELDPETVVHEPCGALEVITTTISGAEYFDAAGNSARIQVHFHYVGQITLGAVTVRNEAHPNAIFRPDGINTLNGQGIAFHLSRPGAGLPGHRPPRLQRPDRSHDSRLREGTRLRRSRGARFLCRRLCGARLIR